MVKFSTTTLMMVQYVFKRTRAVIIKFSKSSQPNITIQIKNKAAKFPNTRQTVRRELSYLVMKIL